MGFRSGEFAGQSNTPTPWSFNQLLVLLQVPPLAVVLLPGSLYTFPHTYGPWPPWLRAWCPCTVMRRAPKKTSISKSAAFKRCRWRLWGGAILWRPILEQICTWLSLQTDYTIRPSWTPLCWGVNNWHNNPEKFGMLIGCALGHQVTPHLRTFFCPGGWGDSFAPRGPHITLNEWKSGVLTHGRRWCGAGIMRMREYTLPTAVVDVGLISCEWECPSTHGSRWCGAGNMWIRVSSTHGSRWCGAGIMWMRVSSTHGRLLLGGWYRVNKRAVSSRQAATDEGLISCEWVRSQLIVICTRQNAALRQGAACLDSGFFRVASAATWEPLAPVSALCSPLRHGRGTWEAGLMSCPACLTGERNVDMGISSLQESLRSTTGRGQTDSF